MYLHQHRFNFPQDILVYVEEYDRQNKTILFDFYDSNEFEKFSSITTNNLEMNQATMVRVINYKKRRITENTYYSIKRETIEFLMENNSLSVGDDSFLIGYVINMENFDEEFEVFTHSVSLNYFWNSNHLMKGKTTVKDLKFNLTGKLSFVVRDVAQGNWNEIINNEDCSVVYDCGTSMSATKVAVRALINTRIAHYIINKPSLFLSHWDKDHYHCLVGMTDAELSCFSNFICRDNVPNLTSRKLFARISRLLSSNNIYSIPANLRTARGGPTIFKPMNNTNSQLVIYNSQYNKDRNISGIILSLKTSSSSVIFSGDSLYSQVSDYILPHLNFEHKHHLVAPHHGGKGGNYIYNNPGQIKMKTAIISVGKNSYGHPLKYYVDSLKKDFTSTLKTSLSKSDIKINL